jgi:serine/threonine protein kinase/WD40 repeat protein
MTLPPSDSSGDDELIARYMQELQASTDLDRVVAEFCSLCPTREGDFRAIADAHRRMNAAAPEPADVPPRLTEGEMLGDFRVVRFLTRGGMGEIYEAEQVCLSHRRVVLKVIRHGKVSPDSRDRFLREQNVLARLHQTNIVPVFAAGERDELQYFAMQYIDGATLGHVVQFLRAQHSRSGGNSLTPSLAKLVASVVEPLRSVAPADATTVAHSVSQANAADHLVGQPVLTDEYCRSVGASLADVADALDAAHRTNVLHRDVKPSNLMAEKSGKCWVIDFGLAGLIGESTTTTDTGTRETEPALTATGAVMGTYAYMAPEQFDGEPEPRSDVWALGATLYELLTLRRPFDGLKRDQGGVATVPTREEYCRQVHEDEPVWPRQLASHVPMDLDAICRKAMQKDAEDRYQTAADFAADLRRWQRSEPTLANPPWLGRRVAMWARRKPGWAAMVAVAWLAFFSIAGLLLYAEQLRLRGAQSTADRETERAAAAESEVRQRDRQLDMLSFQREQLSPHIAGWRDRLWKLGSKLAVGGKEPELRDRMAALLSGLDAKHVPDFKEGAATFLAFDSTGHRLLMGGGYSVGNEKDPKDRSEPTRVRNLLTGEIRRSVQEAVGPVGWRGSVPVQLVPPTKARPSFLLWNVDLNAPIEEFALPDGHEVTLAHRIEGMNIAGMVLSVDAECVAAFAHGPKGERRILVWKSGERSPFATIPVTFPELNADPDALALAPDGSLLALGTDDGRIAVWSLVGAGPKSIREFELGRGVITALTFARHRIVTDAARIKPGVVPGWLLGVGSANGAITVWDLDTHDRVMMSRDSHHEVFALAFSPDGVLLFSTGRAEIRCWDVNSGQNTLRLSPNRNWLPGITLTPDGKRLAVSEIAVFGPAGGVDLFDVEPGRGIQVLRGLTGQVSRITLTADGKRAAGLTQDWQVGVWDVATGELLMRVDAPLALYPDHDDIRLSNDGRFLIIAGGKAAHRWQIPSTRNESPRLVDTWNLRPAFPNRLAITTDGQMLLCRCEAKSGADVLSERIDRVTDPRCVRVYELQPGGMTKEIAQHDDHPWHVHSLHACPDGSYFVADGVKTSDMRSRSIVAYSGQTKDILWQIPLKESVEEGWSMLDSTGTVLDYAIAGESTHFQKVIPQHGQPVARVSNSEYPALVQRIVFKKTAELPSGLQLAVPGATAHFLTLSPDERVQIEHQQFTRDGRFLIWGLENGTVLVCEMDRVRELLKSVGMGWEQMW